MSFFGKLVGLAAIITLTLGVAHAQLDPNSAEDVKIGGANFEAFQEENYVLWTGDVQVQQAASILTTEQLLIRTDSAGEATRYEASGGLRFSDGAAAISGTAGVYDVVNGIITVTGKVLVVQGEQIMAGEKLVYDTVTKKMTFSSNGKSRVRGVFKTGTARTNSKS